MKFYFSIKQFKLNYLTETTTLAPKIVQGQTNVIKCNMVISHVAYAFSSNSFTASDLMEGGVALLSPLISRDWDQDYRR